MASLGWSQRMIELRCRLQEHGEGLLGDLLNRSNLQEALKLGRIQLQGLVALTRPLLEERARHLLLTLREQAELRGLESSKIEGFLSLFQQRLWDHESSGSKKTKTTKRSSTAKKSSASRAEQARPRPKRSRAPGPGEPLAAAKPARKSAAAKPRIRPSKPKSSQIRTSREHLETWPPGLPTPEPKNAPP